MSDQQVWALYDAYNEEFDMYASCVVGPDSPNDEEMLRGHEIPLNPLKLTMKFRAMFDHEPTDQDKDRYAPEGHRSWEQE